MNHTRRIIKFNSLFFRTFLTLTGMLLLLSALIFFGISRFMYHNVQSNMRTEYQKSAEADIDIIDLEVRNIYRSAEQLVNEDELINAAIRPDINDNARTIKILSLLKSTKNYTNGVQNVWLYEYTTEDLYTDDNIVTNLKNYEHHKDIDALLSSSEAYVLERNDYGTCVLKNVNGRLYLCQDFLYAVRNPLSCLIMELDSEYLFSSILQSCQGDIGIYDAFGAPIFRPAGQETYPESLKDDAFQTPGGTWHKNYYLTTSPLSGWHFAIEYNSDFVKLSPLQSFVSLLPFFILFVIIGILFALQVTLHITSPIQNLIALLKNSDNESSARFENAKNEFDFLEQEYHHSLEKESYIQKILKDISSEVVERMLLKLLREEETDIEEIRKVFDNTGTGFSIEGKYSLILVGRRDAADLSDKSLSSYNMQLIRDITSLTKEAGCEWQNVYLDGKLILILCFEPSKSSKEIYGLTIDLLKRFYATSQNWPFELNFGRSYTYLGITRLHQAYNDAQKAYEKHLHEAASIAEVKPEEAIADSLSAKLAFITHELRIGRIKDAREALSGLFVDIAHYEEEAERKTAYRQIADLTAVEEASNKLVTKPESLHDDCYQSFETNEIDRIAAATRLYSDTVFAELDSISQRRKNRYILSAKQYIAEHYQESSLSLSDIADQLDINKSYLSTLFNEVMGERFAEYLNKIRIAKAKELLDSTDKSVNDICLETGFNSVQNFIRVFRKYVGVSPGQYRKR